MRETLYNRVLAVRGVNVTAVSANGNTDGATVGLDQSGADFTSCTMVLLLGARTDGTYTVVPQESPTGSVWTDVPASRLIGSAVITAANGVDEVGVITDPINYPFLRMRVTATVVTSGAGISGLILLGQPGSTPIARS
jgi:hypothetical protein